MRTTRILAIASFIASAVLGCSSVLGGLDEGTARNRAPAPVASESSAPTSGGCVGWLEGFRYRAPLLVRHRGPEVAGYQLKLTLPTSPLVAAGKLRADGADLRVTSKDGVTVVPHWLQDGLGTDKTTLWTSLDLGTEEGAAWLYYGRIDAPEVSSMRSTFAGGIIDDPTFDRTDSWTSAHVGAEQGPASRTNEWSATLGAGKATLRIVRDANTNGATAGICQTMLFPAGSSYRLVFDVDIAIADHGSAAVDIGGLGGNALWFVTLDEPTTLPAIETKVIAPGTQTLCFDVTVDGTLDGQGYEATYSALRIRRYLATEPSIEQVGPEQAAERCR